MSTDLSVHLDDVRAEAEAIRRSAHERLAAVDSESALTELRNQLVGRSSGRLTALMRAIPRLTPEERPQAGALVNALRNEVEEWIARRGDELRAATDAQAPAIDPSMPARHRWRGAHHPVTLVIEEIIAIFREIGFTVAYGPEAETEWYNFGALNFPPDHPAMDMHDTLYVGDGHLLRTHTSPVQVRTLQSYPPPIRVLIPGNVYRRDFFDASHAPMFSQMEGLAVDEGISFVDLKSTLAHFANRLFGETRTRFRPSFFPFTEPSAEMDVQCRLCGGAGCAGCKGTGWMEILGAGMVHPRVLDASGVDSERYTGWAFGMGPGRIAMQRFGLPDIRLLYDSDMRFLEQFAE